MSAPEWLVRLQAEHRFTVGRCTCGWQIPSNMPMLPGYEAHLADAAWAAFTQQAGEAREAVAEALANADGEFTTYSPTAHPDHNYWSWRGDGHPDIMRQPYRDAADAAVAALLGEIGGGE